MPSKRKSTPKPNGFSQKAWRAANPLLTTHVPKAVYDEVKRRAVAERRSLSQFLALYLESMFAAQSMGNGQATMLAMQTQASQKLRKHGA